MIQDIESLIIRVAGEVAEASGTTLPPDLGPESRLFGSQGIFDSLGLVSLLVAVEEAIADQFQREVTLADERALSQARSPFRSIGSLAAYAHELITESGE